MEDKNDELKGANKINYREKNQQYIEKLKEKKQRELDEKMILEKKQVQRRQILKRKILEEATKSRQTKVRQLKDLDNNTEQFRSRNARTGTNFESLPKIPSEKHTEGEGDCQKKNYQQRYLVFLQSLHNANRSKKEIQSVESKKKEGKIKKMRQDLGYTNIDSKLKTTNIKKGVSENTEEQEELQLARSHSADKFESLIQIAQNQMPKTNKNFKRKNEDYINKIKQRRAEEEQVKQEKKLKEQRLKEKLKQYVMTTVKKNVLDGMYDDQLDKKAKKTMKESVDETQKDQDQSDKEQEDSSKKKKRKMRSFPHVTDIAEWRKKNRLEDGEKVFIITGGYNDLKKALMERGWVRNPDFHSPCFDLKFTLQMKELNFDHLQDFQLINHFQKNGVITTKQGLAKTLRNSVWINDISEDHFFPKCYDLNDQDDFVAFETHFKVCKAISILKTYVDSTKTKRDEKFKIEKNLLEDLKLRAEIALSVCIKNIENLDELIDKKKIPKIVTQKQWQVLGSDELNKEGLAKKKHDQWLKSIDCKFGSVGQNNGKFGQKDKKKKKKKKEQSTQGKVEGEEENEQDDGQDQLLERVEELLGEYQRKFPQFNLTGHNNIWILKPSGLSRGRGIICYNNFVQIQDHIKCKESLWIAQKYIQSPLIIHRRKFDIRQWVMITDFNPLTIWFYEECYIRFSAEDYDPKQVNNRFIHLTNNCVASVSKDHDTSHIKGNMFFMEEFSDFLKEKEGSDIYEQKIKPQIKQIIKQSMLCALDGIENRKNTFEMYGYDFMVDEDYKVWLIEINSSPSMDYSTRVTTKLVKEVLTDIPKVIVDYAYAPKKEKKHIDTGKWKKIYKGQEVSQKFVTAGLNLCLEGIPMKKPKRPTVKVQNFSIEK